MINAASMAGFAMAGILGDKGTWQGGRRVFGVTSRCMVLR
jgi:hypothetical protein